MFCLTCRHRYNIHVDSLHGGYPDTICLKSPINDDNYSKHIGGLYEGEYYRWCRIATKNCANYEKIVIKHWYDFLIKRFKNSSK